eukprot:CAMPEP_0172771798 /NCGR_PEP_ID=MMETSP1074-20121228/191186_1 /TAXON_ID=2916 /ORGANISM="Ceratium fusus, Strain PA161109" /LENGTH=86 /DNA_ID=CAMNT_0013607795 /DNA_START=170 /DNA_END=426 /DNA_ORIENTATION=+
MGTLPEIRNTVSLSCKARILKRKSAQAGPTGPLPLLRLKISCSSSSNAHKLDTETGSCESAAHGMVEALTRAICPSRGCRGNADIA